jgi:hypothetical protein
MEASGARVYEDDIALDVRGDYLERRNNYGWPVTQVKKLIYDYYASENDPYFKDVVMLALACVYLEAAH